MISRLGRIFFIALLLLSTLWSALVYASLLHAILFPPADLQAIVSALETHGASPSRAETVVQQELAANGPLRRAVRVGYYSGVVTDEHTGPRKMKMTEMRYVAWFAGPANPILLVLERYEDAGALQGYVIQSGPPMRLVPAFSLPLIVLAFSIYAVRNKWPASSH